MSNAAPTCPKCNTAYRPGSKFCRSCGQALPPAGMPPQPQLPPQPSYPPQLPQQPQQPPYQQQPPQPSYPPQLPQQPPQPPYQQQPPQQPSYPPQQPPPYQPQQPPPYQPQPQQPYQPQPPMLPQTNYPTTGFLENLASRFGTTTDIVSIVLGVGLAILIFICGLLGFSYYYSDSTQTPPVTPTATVAAAVPPTITNTVAATVATNPTAVFTPIPIVITPTVATPITPTVPATPVSAIPPTSTPLPLPPTPIPATPTATYVTPRNTPPPVATVAPSAEVLFEDEFETGIKDSWDTTKVIKTEFVSGELVAQGTMQIYLGVGVPTWKDYTISLEFGTDSQVKQVVIFTRIQDSYFSKYLDVDCQGNDSPLLTCKWQRGSTPDIRQDVLGTEFVISQTSSITIDVREQNYNVLGQKGFFDTENTAQSGGVGLYLVSGDNKPFKLKYFRVVANK